MLSQNQAKAYDEVQTLVNRFKNLPGAKRKSLNEMETRLGYILPMFESLGWNTRDIEEVSPETKVSRGWVDFSFRIHSIPRFFLETKRVKEDLHNQQWVSQTIDYAWTKSVTWALLSDFEGLQIFNAEWKDSNNPIGAKFFEFDLDGYRTDFDRLWWLSRPETINKRLDLEAEHWGKKIKRQAVTQHLFDNLKRWRGILVNDYRKWNKISAAEADAIVLRLINRLIFIRTAEDRQVESPRLRPLIRELEDRKRYDDLSRELSKLFREFDHTYNSELFAPHLLDQSYATYANLKEVIEGLYERHSVYYNFHAIESDVLGTAYEQYLGSVVLDEKEMQKPAQLALLGDEALPLEERRKKRKNQGIYYTPTFITKYIVQQTVGRHLNEHGYNSSAPIRVLDMTSGSGSFLIRSFDVIDDFLARERKQIRTPSIDDDPKKEEEFNKHDRSRQIEILRNCIFGVDKDKQATEVARLNLLLRSLRSHSKMPTLEHIVRGDSLQQDAFETNFPDILKEGGFTVIVGNPPYVRAENMPRQERDQYMAGDLETAYGRFDLFILFIERAIKLLRDGGRLGFIVPYSVLNENYGKLLREFILKSCAIEEIIDLSEHKVFQYSSVSACVLILRKETDLTVRQTNRVRVIRQKSYGEGIRPEAHENWTVTQGVYCETPMFSFRLDFDEQTIALLDKIDQQSRSVGDLCYVITGSVLHNPKTGESKDRLIHKQWKEGYKPYIEAKEITRYVPPVNTRFLDYRSQEMHRPKFPELFENPKIMIQMVAGDSGLIATLDYKHLYTDHSLHLCVMKNYLFGVKRSQIKISADEAEITRSYDPKFLLAHVNSRVGNFYFRKKLEGGLNIYPETVRQLPVKSIDFANPIEKAAYDELVKLVEQMLRSQSERQSVRPIDDLDRARLLDRKIEQLGREIDYQVYRLYGLTDDEIRFMEGLEK